MILIVLSGQKLQAQVCLVELGTDALSDTTNSKVGLCVAHTGMSEMA